MAVKAFMSGVEGQQHYDACLKGGVVHVLTSYFQFYNKGDLDFVKRRKLANPEVNFMVDSGAHTFITDIAKFMQWSKQQFEDYVAGYAEWLKNNRDYIFCGVEFDIDWTLNTLFGSGSSSTVGSAMVESWQKKYFIPLQDKGVPIIFVWHKERGLEGWEKMCSDFPYVGLPGGLSGEPDFNKFMSVAKRYMTKVHGFAATKQADFRDWPWYSVDSITWKTCEMYGTLIHWDERAQKLVFDPDKTQRSKYRAHFEKYGLDADGIINDTNYKDVTKYALGSMRRMEHFYEQRYADREFYYEFRLPVPKAVENTMRDKEARRFWKKLRPSERFKAYANETDPDALRDYLAGLSAIQNKQHAYLGGNSRSSKFLQDVFPKLMLPQISPADVFQKELASLLTPPNPPALERCDREHFIPSNNVAKLRETVELGLADLEWGPSASEVGLADL